MKDKQIRSCCDNRKSVKTVPEFACIEEIISDYKKIQITKIAIPKTLVSAINKAAIARDLENIKHPHQYRIKNSILNEFAVILQSKK